MLCCDMSTRNWEKQHVLRFRVSFQLWFELVFQHWKPLHRSSVLLLS